MTLNLSEYGHSLIVDSVTDADAITDRLSELEGLHGAGADEIYRWLYDGAPVGGVGADE